MKNILAQKVTGIWLFLFLWAGTGYTQGYLKTDGTQIVDEDGNEVIFRGIGLGGWMLQEGYMLKTSGPQHEISARIEALIGPERTREFYDAWLAGHMGKADVEAMAAWGFNAIRLPMHYRLFTPPVEEEPLPGQITWRSKGFEMTDRLLEWCKASNMYLILDLHAAPGGQGMNADISDYDPEKPSLWESEANRKKTIALWKKLAERYADEPMIGAYDIINEPNWGFLNHDSDPNGCMESKNTLLWELQRQITEAIREVDPNHIVIIEGNCWGNNYAGLPELWDDNIVLSYHKYWNGTGQSSIQGMLDMREARNVPIYLGESGENANAWFTAVIRLLEEKRIGWSWWPLKKMGINNPLEIVVGPGYQKMLDYWDGSGSKPSADEAYAALMQLAGNAKFENNIFHKDVVDAMIRQPHSPETLPFKVHTVAPPADTCLFATDFDLGRHGIAYYDNEFTNTSGNAGGVAWNQGYSYRNDGVDIEPCLDDISNGYNVGWTETGEWLQYTVHVAEEGNYTIGFRTAAVTGEGRIFLSANGIKVTESITLPNTGGYQVWETTTFEGAYLESGENIIRAHIDNGGFNLNYLTFHGPFPASGQPELLENIGRNGGNTIHLTFNQPFAPVPEASGFLVTFNGAQVPVTDASLREGHHQVITLLLDRPLKFGDTVRVAYSGASVATASGTLLEAFSGKEVRILLEGPPPIPVPGKIEAENFTVNSGFQLEYTKDAGGGMNIAHTDAGDYLEYQVMVKKAGTYSADFRIASLSAPGALKLQLVSQEGVTDLSSVNFEATGGWQTWQTVPANKFQLDAGLQTLRLLAGKALFNVNWFTLHVSPEEPAPPLGIADSQASLPGIYPNPNSGHFTVMFGQGMVTPEKVHFYDATGRRLFALRPETGSAGMYVNRPLKKGICLVVFATGDTRIVRKLIIH